MSILLSWAQIVHQSLLAVVMALHPNSMQPNQNMVSPSFPRSIYGLPTFSTKKGIGCTSGQNLLASSHQCNHGPTWISFSFFPFYNCLCNHASTKTFICGGTCYITIKYLALSYGFWTLSFGIESQYWENWCLSISWVYISFWPLLGPLGNATHWGRSRKCLAIVCLSYHLLLQSTRKWLNNKLCFTTREDPQ